MCILLNYILSFDANIAILSSSVVLKPLKVYTNLFEIKAGALAYKTVRKELEKRGGVYVLIFTDAYGKSMQYIGSSLNLYDRMRDHVLGRDFNIRL